MTYEQTKEQLLLALNSNAYIGMCECDDMKNAIKAIEKQIPMKPVFVGGRFVCPHCLVDYRSLHHYCELCGQKIDWSEYE